MSKSTQFLHEIYEIMKSSPAKSYTVEDFEKFAEQKMVPIAPQSVSATVSHEWLQASGDNRWLHIHRSNIPGTRRHLYQWKSHKRTAEPWPTRGRNATKSTPPVLEPQASQQFVVGSLAEIIGIISENTPEILVRLENGSLFVASPLANRIA